jgi:hypothetical protein
MRREGAIAEDVSVVARSGKQRQVLTGRFQGHQRSRCAERHLGFGDQGQKLLFAGGELYPQRVVEDPRRRIALEPAIGDRKPHTPFTQVRQEIRGRHGQISTSSRALPPARSAPAAETARMSTILASPAIVGCSNRCRIAASTPKTERIAVTISAALSE